jgi:hypothetical protein
MEITVADLGRAIGFLAAGLSLVIFCLRYYKIESGAMLIALLFAPVLVFLAASGRLVEFKGLGVEAKFQQKANEQIKPKAENIRPLAPSSKDIKGSDTVRRVFAIGTEVVLLTARNSEKEISAPDVFAFAEQIYPGLIEGNFEALVIVDEADRPLGFFPRSYFLDLLRIEILQTIRGKRSKFDLERVVEQLEQTQLWDIVAAPRVRVEAEGVKTTVKVSSTNAEALAILIASRTPTGVVIDSAGKYAGVVKREDIVSALVSSLAAGSSGQAK